LRGLRKGYEDITPASRRLNEYAALAPIPSDEQVFRVNQATDGDLKTNPGPPRREAERPIVINAGFRDLDEEHATRAVLNGGSLLVLGIAGTGKTHYVQGLVEQLRAQGKRVDIISKAHCASQRAGGVTADHWVRRHVLHGACTVDYVWVDEISQINIGLLCQLNKLLYAKVRWLLSGDFNQFPALFNFFRGAAISEAAFVRPPSTILRTKQTHPHPVPAIGHDFVRFLRLPDSGGE
jgi:hypothetical protein